MDYFQLNISSVTTKYGIPNRLLILVFISALEFQDGRVFGHHATNIARNRRTPF